MKTATKTPSKTMVKIVNVNTKKQLKHFIDFPHDLYEGDMNYVPELFIAQRDMLTKGKHPSHDHISFELFMAYVDGKLVGRIAGIYNENHNEYIGEQDGFFGFFDCIDDVTVARQLVESAFDFLRNKNVTRVIGPVNFSTNDPSGLLVDGFEFPPQVMMTYNKPYYSKLLEEIGFQKRMDLFAYWFSLHTIPPRVVSLAKNIENRLQRNGITIRSINMKQFKKEVQIIKDVYNKAWDKNWGFVPMTNKEFDYVAKDMKLILDKDFVLVAEKDGEIIGFTLTLPNINEVLIDVKRGRLLPTGIFKLLFNKSKIKTLRVLTLGVLKQYRALGIEVCFYIRLLNNAIKKGYQGGEASWILEDNELMNRELKNIKSEIYKTYRLYEKELT